MADLNKLICAAIIANTGNGTCCVDFSKIIGIIKVPKGAEITEANATNLQTYIQTQIQAATKTLRWFPMGDFLSLELGGADARTFTYGYGRKVTSGYNDYEFKFETGDCGACEAWQYQSHNKNSKHYFYLIAEDGTIIGRKYTRPFSSTVANPVNVLLPFDGGFEALPIMFTNGTDPNKYALTVTIPVVQLNYGNVGWIRPGTDAEKSYIVESMQGLRTIYFVETLLTAGINAGSHNSHTTTTINVFPLTGCDQENIATLLTTLLAITNWSLTNATTGAVIPITSVAITGTAPNQQVRVTYPTQVAGTKLTLSMANPTVLAAAGFSGWDSAPYTWTV